MVKRGWFMGIVDPHGLRTIKTLETGRDDWKVGRPAASGRIQTVSREARESGIWKAGDWGKVPKAPNWEDES